MSALLTTTLGVSMLLFLVFLASFTGCQHHIASDEASRCIPIDMTGADLGKPVGADWSTGQKEMYVHELADGKKHWVGCTVFLPCSDPTFLPDFGFEACVDQSRCLDFGRK